MLARQHPHPRDDRIQFIADTHTYLVDGSSDGILSVTTFIHHHFPSFDAVRIVREMNPIAKRRKYGSLTDTEIRKKWQEDGRQSAERGTRLHLAIERFYNGEADVATPEFALFLAFHETVKERLTPFRTEWSIFDGEIDLAGQLDMLYQKEDGTYALYDWKCIKELKRENAYEKGKGVCSDLDHCNFNHYSLQLHIYKKILETRYAINVTEMKLVILHPDLDRFQLHDVRDVSDVVDQMFAERAARLA